MSEIYVVVCERDLPDDARYKDFETQGIVMETTLDMSGLNTSKERIKHFNGRFGSCRIAKLVFIDEDTK